MVTERGWQERGINQHHFQNDIFFQDVIELLMLGIKQPQDKASVPLWASAAFEMVPGIVVREH